MGKIGDLFVRLGLKSDGFKKGMQDAKKETQDFGSRLGQLKTTAVGVWAAIGSAVIKFGADFIAATNASADAWDQKVSGMKAGWQSYLASVQNNYSSLKKTLENLTKPGALTSNFIASLFRADAARKAAEDMTEAFDAGFELEHSVRLQRLAVQQELNELYTKMRDTTLSNADRRAAANRYKQLLQPIANSEVQVLESMLNSAIDAWQAGLDNRSREDVIEFFTKIGTEAEAMAQKFPDIFDVYQNYKSDEENLPIFDIIAKYKQAANQMSEIDRLLGRTINSIKAKTAAELQAIANEVKRMGKEDFKIDLELDVELDEDDIDISEHLELMNEDITRFLEEWADKQRKIEALNNALEDSFISAFSGGLQALTDLMFGLDNAGWEQVLAAFIQPLASTMRQMGEMFIAEGIAVTAFKESIKNPAALIAAGAALIAVSAAVTSGLNKLVGNPAGGTAASSGAGSTSAREITTHEQEITVHVVGEISGNNIVLAGQKTLNKWNR